MYRYKQIFVKFLVAILILSFIISSFNVAEASLVLTDEEKAYVAEKKIVKAVSAQGAAPIIYSNSNGQVLGIAKNVAEEISRMTGLVFEYNIYPSPEEALKSDFDIFVGMPSNYAPDDMVLSQPYLKSKTILYINSSLDSNNLDDKIYAAVKGSALPQGIKEENSIYFDSREESLNAVEAGKADYGYGNAYSVSFYTIQNNFKNIITIPNEKEEREYCFGFVKKNDLLLSIINKSINEISEERMQNLILDGTLHIDRNITISMIMGAYGKEVLTIAFGIICILLFSIVSYINTNRSLIMQNRRNEILSQISNEYLYEYSVADDCLELSEECVKLFGSEAVNNEVAEILKDILSDNTFDVISSTVKLPLANGETGVFKTVNLIVYDNKGKRDSIIGKLIDITEYATKKEELIIKSQTDGLTGIYNAITTKELIAERIKSKDEIKTDVLILMDCDNFKYINDNFGHLTGDSVLEGIAGSLKSTFRNYDIIGRIGGDEFCVYLNDIASVEFIQLKFMQLRATISKETGDVNATISMGAVFVYESKTYEDYFEMADSALYQAKRNGGDQLAIYNDKI